MSKRGSIIATEVRRQQSLNRQRAKWGEYTTIKRILKKLLAGEESVSQVVFDKNTPDIYNSFYGFTRGRSTPHISAGGRMHPPSHWTRSDTPIHWRYGYRLGKSRNPKWLTLEEAYTEAALASMNNLTGASTHSRLTEELGYTAAMIFFLNPSL